MKNLNEMQFEFEPLINDQSTTLPKLQEIQQELQHFGDNHGLDGCGELDREIYEDLLARVKEQIARLVGPSRSGYGGAPPAGQISSSAGGAAGGAAGLSTGSGGGAAGGGQSGGGHSPEVMRLMTEADRAFYSGRYQEAIKLYDQVLMLEPDYARARDNLKEADTHLKNQDVPEVALPEEAADLFGRAQSAERRQLYDEAIRLVSEAIAIVRSHGFPHWKAGKTLKEILTVYSDANSWYRRAEIELSQGNFKAAHTSLQEAYKLHQRDEYKTRLDEVEEILSNLNQAKIIIYSNSPGAEQLLKAKNLIGPLMAAYGDRDPELTDLKLRLDERVRSLKGMLMQNVQDALNRSRRAPTLNEASKEAQAAFESHTKLEALVEPDREMAVLKGQVEERVREVDQNSMSLVNARNALDRSGGRWWPRYAYQMAEGVLEAFPEDPDVAKLSKAFERYRVARGCLAAGVALGVIAILVLSGMFGLGKYRAYQLALTPATATSTPTATFTPIPPTPTETPLPPTATLTPIPPTPTPRQGTTSIAAWLKDGCYRKFNSLRRIPKNAVVEFMPVERRVDETTGLICFQVRFIDENGAEVIGWLQESDLAR